MLVFWISDEVDHHVFDNGHVLRAVAASQTSEIVLEHRLEHSMQPVRSRPEGFHLRPLSEWCGSLSIHHTAHIKQTRPWSLSASVRTDAAVSRPGHTARHSCRGLDNTEKWSSKEADCGEGGMEGSDSSKSPSNNN